MDILINRTKYGRMTEWKEDRMNWCVDGWTGGI